VGGGLPKMSTLYLMYTHYEVRSSRVYLIVRFNLYLRDVLKIRLATGWGNCLSDTLYLRDTSL